MKRSGASILCAVVLGAAGACHAQVANEGGRLPPDGKLMREYGATLVFWNLEERCRFLDTEAHAQYAADIRALDEGVATAMKQPEVVARARQEARSKADTGQWASCSADANSLVRISAQGSWGERFRAKDPAAALFKEDVPDLLDRHGSGAVALYLDERCHVLSEAERQELKTDMTLLDHVGGSVERSNVHVRNVHATAKRIAGQDFACDAEGEEAVRAYFQGAGEYADWVRWINGAAAPAAK